MISPARPESRNAYSGFPCTKKNEVEGVRIQLVLLRVTARGGGQA